MSDKNKRVENVLIIKIKNNVNVFLGSQFFFQPNTKKHFKEQGTVAWKAN